MSLLLHMLPLILLFCDLFNVLEFGSVEFMEAMP